MKNKSQENTLKSRLGPKNHSKLVLAVTKREHFPSSSSLQIAFVLFLFNLGLFKVFLICFSNVFVSECE